MITELQAAKVSAYVSKRLRTGKEQPDGERTTCDGTLRLTKAAVSKLGVKWEDAEHRLMRGGPCDCEMLMNATNWEMVKSITIGGGTID